MLSRTQISSDVLPGLLAIQKILRFRCAEMLEYCREKEIQEGIDRDRERETEGFYIKEESGMS